MAEQGEHTGLQGCTAENSSMPDARDSELGTIEVPRDEVKTATGEGEATIESLLGSLMRALNTEQGRQDFARLTEDSMPT